MTLQEIMEYLNTASAENSEIPNDKFVSIINELTAIMKRQNEILNDIKNCNIRMENRIKYVENELNKSRMYKNIVESMLGKISTNPVSALIYLYKVKKNLEKLSQEK